MKLTAWSQSSQKSKLLDSFVSVAAAQAYVHHHFSICTVDRLVHVTSTHLNVAVGLSSAPPIDPVSNPTQSCSGRTRVSPSPGYSLTTFPFTFLQVFGTENYKLWKWKSRHLYLWKYSVIQDMASSGISGNSTFSCLSSKRLVQLGDFRYFISVSL